MGMPSEKIVKVNKFLTCLFRRFSTAASSVGPSTPQFQLRLSFELSRLPSPFASLCFTLKETRSFSVKRMTRYEINALLGFPFFVAVNLRTAEEPISKFCHGVIITPKEAAHIVAKPGPNSEGCLRSCVERSDDCRVREDSVPGRCGRPPPCD